MEKIVWGIIGCGDVTEVKSGPAFNKVPQSKLHAVMRRDIAKAEDYARRHGVPKFYSNASELINDPEINAIYIATPPDSHEQYSLEAIAAGKPVYIEKPMALNYTASLNIMYAAEKANVKISVAHYRNAQPFFISVNQAVKSGRIGEVKYVQLKFLRPALTADQLKEPGKAWRVDPAISGGGLFHDLAPHQLGILISYFGEVEIVSGKASSSLKKYSAADKVNAEIVFKNGIQFSGKWNFDAAADIDECSIIGTKGKIVFPFFGKHQYSITDECMDEAFSFEPPMHVQQPLIEKVVQFFLGNADNPCSAAEGCEVMRIMEECVGK